MKSIGIKMVVILSLIVTIFVSLLSQIPPIRTFEARYADLLMTFLAAKSKPSSDIVIVKITEDTLAKFPYRSPFDRGYLADMIEKIIAAKPIAVGVDLLMDQPSEPDKDARLFKVLEDNADKVFVAYAGHESDGLSKAQYAYQDKVLANASKALPNIPRDPGDGVVRHFLESRIYDEDVIPALAHAIAGTWQLGLSTDLSRIVYQHKDNGRPYKFTTYPAHAVQFAPPKWFEKKYVLIGVDLPFDDRHRTPFNSTTPNLPLLDKVSNQEPQSGKGRRTKISDDDSYLMPGVTIHAHIVDQLLANVRLKDVTGLRGIVLFWVAGFIGLIIVRVPAPIWVRTGLLLIGIGACVGFSVLAFEIKSTLVPTIPMIVTMLGSAILGSAILWQSDRQEKRFVRDAWSHYVSPDVVDDMILNPEKMKLGGEKMDVTFIFTDIAGFTTMAENMPVEQLSVVLNDYLDRVSAEFTKAGATLDKFVGDAVIGFLGAPIPNENHPDKAIALAIAIDNVCREYQAEMVSQGIKFGHTRIGVHSGTAVIGNFGGSNFFDYTALGDTVNTAARLEGANKLFASHVCVSGATAGRAIAHEFRPMGRLLLAGKSKAVEAWEPVEAVKIRSTPLGVYRNAYAELDKGTKSGLQTFKSLAEEYPDDYLVKFHLGRLKNGFQSTLIDRGSNK